MKKFGLLFVAVTTVALTAAINMESNACPFCSAPSLTLTEQVSQSDAVVLVQWLSGKKPTDQEPGFTIYEVMDITRDAKNPIPKGKKIQLSRYRSGTKGDLFILMGTEGKTIDWGSPVEVTDDGYKYMAEAPSPEMETASRLEYFINYLEHSDQLVSNDAYAEFANAPYEDISMISDKLPRTKIRDWVKNADTPGTRLGLYGLLLGLSGDEADAKVMESRITEKSSDFRLGIDGIMSGYLLLKGDKGLDTIDRTKLMVGQLKDKEGNPVEIPFSETYAAMQALRFMWTYGNDRIPKERLRKSMRHLLDRPELADLVIADLARWKDWSIQDRLLKIYDDEAYNVRAIKRAVIRYFYYCSIDVPKDEHGEPIAEKKPAHAISAEKHLKVLEIKDPKMYRDAKRYLLD